MEDPSIMSMDRVLSDRTISANESPIQIIGGVLDYTPKCYKNDNKPAIIRLPFSQPGGRSTLETIEIDIKDETQEISSKDSDSSMQTTWSSMSLPDTPSNFSFSTSSIEENSADPSQGLPIQMDQTEKDSSATTDESERQENGDELMDMYEGSEDRLETPELMPISPSTLNLNVQELIPVSHKLDNIYPSFDFKLIANDLPLPSPKSFNQGSVVSKIGRAHV